MRGREEIAHRNCCNVGEKHGTSLMDCRVHDGLWFVIDDEDNDGDDDGVDEEEEDIVCTVWSHYHIILILIYIIS